MKVEHLGPLAALLAGLPADALETRRLILQAMVKMRDTHPTVAYGPLERVFHFSPRWYDDEVSQLLTSGHDGRDLMIQGLSLMLYLSDAHELPPIVLSPEALTALREYEPRTAADRITYIRACTAVGLASALDLAVEAARDPQTATLTSLTTHPRYGAETVNCLGDVLT